MNSTYTNNTNQNYQMTGKMVPMPRQHFVNSVYEAMGIFKRKLLQGDPNPTPNPLIEPLILSNGERSVMIPTDIQNEAIMDYLKTDPQLSSMVGRFTPLRNTMQTAGRGSLVDNNAFEVDDDTEEGQVFTEDGEDEYSSDLNRRIKRKVLDNKEKTSNTVTIIVCILIVVFLLFMFGDKLKV